MTAALVFVLAFGSVDPVPSDSGTLSQPALQRHNALPQTLPFSSFATAILNFGVTESEGPEGEGEEEGPWAEFKLGEDKAGAPRRPGTVRWTSTANAARAAWGMLAWAERKGAEPWKEHGEEFMRLTLENLERPAPAERFVVAKRAFAGVMGLEAQCQSAQWVFRSTFEGDEAEAARTCVSRTVRRATTALAEGKALVKGAPMADVVEFLCIVAGSPKAEAEMRTEARRGLALVSKALARLKGRGGARPDYTQALVEWKRSGLPVPSWPTLATEARALANRLGPGSDSSDHGRTSRQAVALLQAGSELGSQELFEVGASSLRGLLRYLHEGTIVANGVKVSDRVPLATMASSVVPGGPANTWKGYEAGEGQLVATLALVAREFGGFYVHRSGWAVGIDGCRPGPDNEPVSLLSSNPFPFGGVLEVEVVRDGRPAQRVVARVEPSICRMEVFESEGRVYILAVPGSMPTQGTKPVVKGTFTRTGSKWNQPASIGLKGFVCPWPSGVRSGRFRFQGVIDGHPVDFGPVRLARP